MNGHTADLGPTDDKDRHCEHNRGMLSSSGAVLALCMPSKTSHTPETTFGFRRGYPAQHGVRSKTFNDLLRTLASSTNKLR